MKNSIARKLRQVPEGYGMVGVDPHKRRHAAVVMTQDFVVRSKFKFDNSREGFEGMLQRVKAEMARAGWRGLMFGLETGGHYWRNLAYFLDARGIPFRLISQFTLKRRREGKDLNRRKNDFHDAEVAAQLLSTGEFTDTRLPYDVYAELRAAYSAYRRLVKESGRLINLLKGLLDSLFPEFTQVFKDPAGKTAMSVFSCCPVPGVIAQMGEDDFIRTIRANHQGRLMRERLRHLHRLAQASIGIKEGTEAVSLEVSLVVERLSLTQRQIERLIKLMTRLVDATEEGPHLLSIPGVGYITVAGMLGELGSFKNYQNAKQLIKMAGSNPTEAESGGKRSKRTPMSKKGRPGLRYCGWIGVIPLLRHNMEFRAWARRLKERPVHAHPLKPREIIGAAVNKLLRLSFALVKKKAFYQMPKLAEVAG